MISPLVRNCVVRHCSWPTGVCFLPWWKAHDEHGSRGRTLHLDAVFAGRLEGERYSVKALERQQPMAENPNVDRTLSLIDAFLSSLPEEPSAPGIITLPVEAATDYTSYLMQSQPEAEPESTHKLKGQDLIDNFLEKSEEQPLIASVADDAEDADDEKVPLPEEEMEDESYFTETLAKIYVKQQRYSKALEIIRRLNLKYPKKNAYFADQIRFLEKLIINAKSK